MEHCRTGARLDGLELIRFGQRVAFRVTEVAVLVVFRLVGEAKDDPVVAVECDGVDGGPVRHLDPDGLRETSGQLGSSITVEMERITRRAASVATVRRC